MVFADSTATPAGPPAPPNVPTVNQGVAMALRLVREQEVPTFSEFWSQYPKKVEKQQTEQEWNKLSDADKCKALSVLPAHCAEWAKSDPHYILYAHRWIKRRRFDDELEVDLHVTPCHWKGCDKPGTKQNGSGIYCEKHYAALRRGESA